MAERAGSRSYTSPPPPGAGGPLPDDLLAGTRSVVLASYGRRVAAFVVDALIVSAAAVAIMAPLGAGFFAVESGMGVLALVAAFILAVLIIVAVAFLYAPVLMWQTNGKTVGRMVAGTRVIRMDRRPIGFGLAFVREVLLKVFAVGVASTIIPLLPFLLNVLWPLWDEENRALHDFPVDTRTIVD
jgi:uncharacterized RDD family membrane protein YckC